MTLSKDTEAIRNLTVVVSRKLDLYRAIIRNVEASRTAKENLVRTIGRLEPLLFLSWEEIRKKEIDPQKRLEELDLKRIWDSIEAQALTS